MTETRAVILPASLCGSLWTDENEAEVHYDGYLCADRVGFMLIRTVLGANGLPVAETTERGALKDFCHDSSKSEDFIWWVRGFLGIPAKYKGT